MKENTNEDNIESKLMSSNKVNQSSSRPDLVSIVDGINNLCRVEKIVNDDGENLKQLQVLEIAKYSPKVFDVSLN